jgi:DNA-nicking Smr family endonuclease
VPPSVAAPWRPAPFRVGDRAEPRRGHDLALPVAEVLARQPLRMDAALHARLRRGKLAPEARIDLHGLTTEQAHAALTGFVLGARAEGRRLLLVITGKGRLAAREAPLPPRLGRLRHDVPRWLRLPPLAGAVLQLVPAHRRHGGEGALYIWLRAPGRTGAAP